MQTAPRIGPDAASPEPILLVAVSARMLARLALDAGYAVIALDRFGDLDLRRACPSVSLAHDLGGRGGMAALVETAKQLDAPSVVYGAGLENRPDLVGRLAAGRRLLGTTPGALARVRDPFALACAVRAAGHPFPLTLDGGQAPRSAGRSRRWLCKPARGGGGSAVGPYSGGTVPRGAVVQQRVDGLACSAAAVADGRSATVLGLSEQLVGRRALGARGFAWCGNVTPPRLARDERGALLRAAPEICAHLATAFELRGLFGVDLVWDGARAWVLEVNPRPTASLEVLEAAGGVTAFAAHVNAFAGRLHEPPAPARAAGKAVVYARGPLRVGDTRDWPSRGRRDVPHPGEHVAAGHPVCTLVATGPTPQGVVERLEIEAGLLRVELGDAEEAHAPV